MTLMPGIEIRQAVRQFRRTPGLSAMAVVALGVGIGLATAAFSFTFAVVSAELPFAGGDRIVRLRDVHRLRGYDLDADAAAYTRLREAASSFDRLVAFYTREASLETGPGATGTVQAAFVTPDFFGLAGVQPALGRGFTPDDARPAAVGALLIADDVWKGRFGANPDVVGREVRLGVERRRIVGVMPPGYHFPLRHHAWAPVETDPRRPGVATARLVIAGRLAPGVTREQAAAEIGTIGARSDDPFERDGVVRHQVIPYVDAFQPPELGSYLSVGVVALVLLLLVAAANVATLLAARTAARAAELAVRTALGASRASLVGQLFAEALAFAVAGAVIGATGASWALGWFTATAPDAPFWIHPRVDATVLAFAALLTLVSGAAASLAPALGATGGRMLGAPKAGGRGTSNPQFGRLTTVLVGVEVAVAIGFLGGAAVFGRAFYGYGRQDYRLPADRLLVTQLYFGQPDLSLRGGARRTAWTTFLEDVERKRVRIVDAIGALPGVTSVTYASHLPGYEIDEATVEIEGGAAVALTHPVAIGPAFFETLGATLVAGRGFDANDLGATPTAVIVNEPFARKHLGGGSPLGRRLRLIMPDDPGAAPGPWLDVVGVAPDLALNPGDPGRADGVYLPWSPTTLVRVAVGAAADPDALAPAVRDVALEIDPDVWVQGVERMDTRMAQSALLLRTAGTGLLLVGGITLLLSTAGLYAIVSFAVSARTREIGIRVALGAAPRDVVDAIVRRVVWQLSVGGLAGAALGVLFSRATAFLPFDVQGDGPLVVVAAAALMAVAGLAACAGPVRRALAVRPVEALRQE